MNGAIYVANQDALVRFDYRDGQTEASGPPTKVTDLPSAINHHWTKALTASADGRFLYVGIGSNSNITERGMDAEVDRAMVWQIDAQTGAHKPYATGLRNPTALAIQPGTGQLWAAVNERDEIGPNLVPDYLTSVREGGFYGWPYSYWGQNVDPRAQPQDPQKVAVGDPAGLQPGIARGGAWCGILQPRRWARDFAEGAFVGEHGSWNRSVPSATRWFSCPSATAVRPATRSILSPAFWQTDGNARGRPVGVTVDPRGALIVADDLSNTIWRITKN